MIEVAANISTRGQGTGSCPSTPKGEAAEGIFLAPEQGALVAGSTALRLSPGRFPGGALSAFVNILSPGGPAPTGDIIVQNQPLEKPLISFFHFQFFCVPGAGRSRRAAWIWTRFSGFVWDSGHRSNKGAIEWPEPFGR